MQQATEKKNAVFADGLNQVICGSMPPSPEDLQVLNGPGGIAKRNQLCDGETKAPRWYKEEKEEQEEEECKRKFHVNTNLKTQDLWNQQNRKRGF